MFRPGRFPRNQAERAAAGAVFGEADIAASYGKRPPYAPALYEHLLAKVSGRARALDIGCGPGKVAIALSGRFAEVVALDPSAAMLAQGRAAAGARANIRWVEGLAEAYEDDGRFDLVSAGTSIHWPDHSALFPKLAAWTPMLAVIEGDAPPEPPCGTEAWIDFLTRWIARMGGRYDIARATSEARRHEAWMAIEGRERFPFTFRQPVADFVESQHSRATWSRAVMGGALAAAFDTELTALIAPFAEDGILTLQMVSELTWGRPLAAPRR